MNPAGRRILLTGATGGIGRELALKLAARGAELALVCFDAQKLNALADEINARGGKADIIVADFNHAHAAQGVADAARLKMGDIDVLINNAGILDFVQFSEQNPDRIAQMIRINLTVPLQLTRALLPDFIARGSGQIVNIGSIFGSIGFPHYASYSATKFALRGFSQALRRELAGHAVAVTYIAPRGVRTAINSDAANAVFRATGTRLDTPEYVADKIVQAMIRGSGDCYIGQPESFFAWLNGLLPQLVSFGLKKQTALARAHVGRTRIPSR